MKIDLTAITKEVGKKLNFDLSEQITIDQETQLSSPVQVKASLLNTGKSILLTGTVKTSITSECGRCLKEIKYPMEFEIEEQYCKSITEYKDVTGEVELTDEDFIYLIEQDNTIDLYEILRQNIISRLPIKVLCQEDCKGLNIEAQPTEDIDPRLAMLKEIKQLYQNNN